MNKTERTFSTLQIRVKVSFCVFHFTYNQIFGVFRGCSGFYNMAFKNGLLPKPSQVSLDCVYVSRSSVNLSSKSLLVPVSLRNLYLL